MAIIHDATLTPSKPELLAAWLDRQPWAGSGELEVLGSYRFDDPAGEVGVEAFVVRRGGRLLHAALTYRGGALDGADDHLVGTLEHSVLGTRWVYDATADPVAQGCYLRALRGEQEQAVMELWDGDTLVGSLPAKVQVRREAGRGEVLRLAEVLDAGAPSGAAPGGHLVGRFGRRRLARLIRPRRCRDRCDCRRPRYRGAHPDTPARKAPACVRFVRANVPDYPPRPRVPGSPPLGQHRLQVDDRGAVERLEVAHVHPGALDGEDLDVVEPDRVRPVG